MIKVKVKMSMLSFSTYSSVDAVSASATVAASLTGNSGLSRSSSQAFSLTSGDVPAETATNISGNELSASFSTTAVTSPTPPSPGSDAPSGGDGDLKAYSSVFFLMAGIVLARFGEWLIYNLYETCIKIIQIMFL